MLWPDWKRRKEDLLQMSAFFKEGNYVETSSRIEKIVRFLEMTKLDTSRFKAELVDVISNFRREFTQNNKFRQECFQQIESIIASALLEQKSGFYNKLLELYPLIRSLREPSQNIDTIKKVFLNLDARKFERERFYGLCFLYLIVIEGIYDEWMRILYALKMAAEGINVSLNDVRKKTLWDIRGEFRKVGVSDILFEGWEEKNIRNAIGHARFSYDENTKQMTFVNIGPRTGIEKYRRSFTYNEFVETGLKVELVYYISEHILFLLRIWDLIVSPNPYKGDVGDITPAE